MTNNTLERTSKSTVPIKSSPAEWAAHQELLRRASKVDESNGISIKHLIEEYQRNRKQKYISAVLNAEKSIIDQREVVMMNAMVAGKIKNGTAYLR